MQMDRNKKILSCIVACALITMPLAACSKDSIVHNDAITPETEWTPGGVPDQDIDPPSAPDTRPPSENDVNGNGESPEVEPPNASPTIKAIKYIRTNTNGLNIRTGPSTSYASLGAVEKGVLLKYDGKTDGFYKTTYLNRTAYVSANPSYTTITSMDVPNADNDIENVINEGLKVLGTKYVYGATRYHYGNGTRVPGFKVSEFDCSSLMQYIFYMGANKLLDMNSRTQSLQGTHVNRSDLKRGDLMFFTNASRKDKTGIERIGHVGLYLGDNYILHTASDYAKVEQINSTRWGYYITARRMIQ